MSRWLENPIIFSPITRSSKNAKNEIRLCGVEHPLNVRKPNLMLPKKTRRRSQTGCLTCRARRVKCDSNVGVCGNCERLHEICRRGENSGNVPLAGTMDQSPETLTTLTKAGIKRRRTLISCLSCRTLKRKCSGERPICGRCHVKNLNCSYNDSSKNSSSSSEYNHSPVKARIQLSTLVGTQLPDKTSIRSLVDRFFAEVYPCRMLGFLHKPSFILRLEQGYGSTLEEMALLLTICAVATKINYADNPDLWEIGSQWANQAHHLLTTGIDTITVSNLMSVILLHEHEYRVGKLSACFLLTGLAARMCQALQINLEYDFDILCSESTMPCTEKESRRRLMWACYFLDSSTSSGVKQLQLLDEADIKIQLPCGEDHFLFQRPCITETMVPGEVLKFINIFDQTISPAANMDYRAYMVRIMKLRNKVLNYVKRFMEDEDPWSPSSEFSLILSELVGWKMNLPADLSITPSIMYIRKEQGLLSTLFQIHLLYHLCYCDLYRIVMPGLSYPKTSSIEAIQIAAPIAFLTESQDTCYNHACSISDIFQKALSHAPHSLVDPSLAIAAHESTRIQIVYITKIAADRVTEEKVGATIKLIESNVVYLQAMTRRIPSLAKVVTAVEKVMEKSQLFAESSWRTSFSRESSPEPPGETSPQISPDYKLHPLSSFASMRETIAEKHAPQTSKYLGGSSVSPSGSSLDISLLSSMMTSSAENWLIANQQGVLF